VAAEPGSPGHTNLLYALRDGKPIMLRQAREALGARWEVTPGSPRRHTLLDNIHLERRAPVRHLDGQDVLRFAVGPGFRRAVESGG